MVRILIADDHLLFRQVIREVIASEPDLEVVAEAGNGQEAALLAAEMQPDVVLMDLAMPVCDGFEATERVRACSPQARVVIFSGSDQIEDVLSALQCGAVGYITKDVGPDSLLTAIRRAAQDELFILPPLAPRLLALLRTLPIDAKQVARNIRILNAENHVAAQSKKKSKRGLPLSQREKEILALVRQGQRNREIARGLRISEATVHKHLQNIFEKLNAHTRAEAIYRATV